MCFHQRHYSPRLLEELRQYLRKINQTPAREKCSKTWIELTEFQIRQYFFYDMSPVGIYNWQALYSSSKFL